MKLFSSISELTGWCMLAYSHDIFYSKIIYLFGLKKC